MILYSNIIIRKNEKNNIEICSMKTYIKCIGNIERNEICTSIIY